MENLHSQALTALEKQTRMVGAWLVSQVFTRLDFSDTIFEKARCEHVSFICVNLRKADFRGAFLTGAHFLECELAGARFSGATLTGARFVACSGLEPDLVRALRERGAEVSDSRGPGAGGLPTAR